MHSSSCPGVPFVLSYFEVNNPISCRAISRLFVLILGGIIPFAGQGQTAGIWLRNESILTPPKPAATSVLPRLVPSASVPSSGLYLVQFEGPVEDGVREQLRSMGVELLKYVPSHAYIARFRNASPDAVRALASVRYVGNYRPDLKIHPRLTAQVASPSEQQSNSALVVNIVLPAHVSKVEMTRVKALLGLVQHETHLRQGIIIRAEINAANLAALSQNISVLWVEPASKRKLIDEQASKIVGGDDGLVATPTLTQQLGFTGAGVTVCVADTGLDTGITNTMHPDLRGRVTGFKYYGTNIADASDGYGHGTHCAGIVAGNAATGETDTNSGTFFGLGVAPGASIFVERIFDEAAGEASPFPSDATLTQDAVRNGAKIGSNSWGTDGPGSYDTDAMQFDELVRDADPGTPGDQPYILEFSAGNAGPGSQTMDSPASAKNVIATGASENVATDLALSYGLYADGQDTMADFSSRGPCEDGRIKPDLVAPGSWIASLASSAAPNLSAIAWQPIDNYYVYMGGTSMSGPHAAGAAAIFVQYYKSLHTNAIPSPALVKAALINSASELDESNGGPGPIPNFDEGWGRIALTNIIFANPNAAPRIYQYLDQTVLLTNSQVYSQHTFVQSSGQPLKITLAYTDVPGFAGAIPALVNDLNLEVVAPDGTIYRGNQFTAGESIANATASDNLNNVEGVLISQPLTGDYTIRVRATNVVEDARLDTSAVDQDFALVVSGDLSRQGVGVLQLDRAEYTAPGVMQIEVFDAGRATSSTVSVVVQSGTEPAGETCTLHNSGNYGYFTNSIATLVGPASVDGKLEIHNGDFINAYYIDSTGTTREADAMAQLIPPVLSGVTAVNDLGIMAIQWQSGTPASSIVRYSTNLTFSQSVTNNSLVTSHSIKLSRLVAGRTYFYYVVSTDTAGNTATNNNGGSFYSFVAPVTPTILLVDDYDTAGVLNDGGNPIPDSTWTNAITAAGFKYSFWKVTDRGYPSLGDLQGFQVVMWRTTDEIVNYEGDHNTLTPQQQAMIQTYLNGGGSFFMASLEILSGLGNVAFRNHVLQVARFDQNPDAPAQCDCDEYFGVPMADGVAGNSISSGMGITLDYSSYPSFDDGFGTVYGPDFSDTFTAGNAANIIFTESVSGKTCGISYPAFGLNTPGRVVFLSFPLETIPYSGTAPNNEVVVLRNSLKFLAPGANGNGVVILDSLYHTIPDVVQVEVGDSDLAGTGSAQVVFSTSSKTNKVTVTLSETAHPGLFSGSVRLVATNATSGQLATLSGDTITAAYFDASLNSNVIATAVIDTNAPFISQVASSAQYTDATVTWKTSEATDALVQYGEGPLPDRTAYSSLMSTNHTIPIGGLSANRIYYYQVVSRDTAGNSTVDDNHGAMYSFTTQPGLRPPWFDDMESGAPGWTVVPDPAGSDLNWQIGTPANGLATHAYSGTNSWGSNLKGTNFDQASTFLISPVIDLSGVSSATLTFWENFDFSANFSGYYFDDGQVCIITNSNPNLATLPAQIEYSQISTGGWVQDSLNLTPYAGRAIRVAFYFAGTSLFGPDNGWLIDDVAITNVVTGGGTIVVTKNLSQGNFTLSGPISFYGTHPVTIITNAPPGQYSVDFGDVFFYQTPASQTNTLALNQTLNFNASYTFIDANHNGISDAWEQYYFGDTSTNRTQKTDTDGDGMTDYAEFIAGTDPTNVLSNLRFLKADAQTNGAVHLQWAVIPGRSYQVLTSTNNLHDWQAVSPWMQAVVSPMNFTATNSFKGPRMYKVQVIP